MADKKDKDLEPEKEVVREIHVQSQICHLCGLLADDVIPMRLRMTPPIDGVVDPAYEYDYGVPVCGECRTRINLACACAELEEIANIRAEAADLRHRVKMRVATFLALEEEEEDRISKNKQNEEDPEEC